MKTCNAQIENVKELLHNIIGVAVGYDGYSNKDSLKNLIDEMSVWACEALKILEELPKGSREKEADAVQRVITVGIEKPFRLEWFDSEIGFGEFWFYTKDEKVYCDNELMSREYVKMIMKKFLENVVMRDGEKEIEDFNRAGERAKK